MAKKYKGSLNLEWFNKQKAIVNLNEDSIKSTNDIPAPRINWINKEEALFYELNEKEGKGNTPYWVNRDDIRVKEARPLVFQKAFKVVEQDKEGTLPGTDTEFTIQEIDKEEDALDIENMLIKGDNLLALNTLKKHFNKLPENEKIKCIYIDPPFNTEQAFEHYDDNLEHSEWLTMMRDRLIILKSLLRYDGLIVVHLDSNEIHYAKIMLDEIFGRENFISDITYERSSVAGLGQGGIFVSTSESILFYHNGIININTVLAINEIEAKTLKRYNKYIVDFGEKELIDEFDSKSNNLPVKIFKHNNYNIETISLSKFEERKEEIFKQYIDNFDTVYRPFLVQKENQFQHDLISRMDKENLYSVEYTPSRGKHKGKNTELHYIGNGLIAWLKDTASISDDSEKIEKETKLSTVWKHHEIPKADLHNEGNVTFARSKKPENLISRILELCTDEEDIVLDCFGGSGTTFAVAHKLKRKWIGIEIGSHADTHIFPRMISVLNGSDQSGISKSMNWNGGSSFKYYHLGESIISIDEETKKGEFNWSLGKQFIQESLLQSYDFVVQDINVFPAQIFQDEDNKPTVGKIVGSSNKAVYGLAFLATPQESNLTITNEEVKTIYSTLKKHSDFQSLVIYSNKGIDIAQDTIPEDLAIIKVPHAIFSELER